MKVKCPYCGFEPTKPLPVFMAGDLIACSKCNGRIDVEKTEGVVIFVKSVDTTFGID